MGHHYLLHTIEKTYLDPEFAEEHNHQSGRK